MEYEDFNYSACVFRSVIILLVGALGVDFSAQEVPTYCSARAAIRPTGAAQCNVDDIWSRRLIVSGPRTRALQAFVEIFPPLEYRCTGPGNRWCPVHSVILHLLHHGTAAAALLAYIRHTRHNTSISWSRETLHQGAGEAEAIIEVSAFTDKTRRKRFPLVSTRLTKRVEGDESQGQGSLATSVPGFWQAAFEGLSMKSSAARKRDDLPPNICLEIRSSLKQTAALLRDLTQPHGHVAVTWQGGETGLPTGSPDGQGMRTVDAGSSLDNCVEKRTPGVGLGLAKPAYKFYIIKSVRRPTTKVTAPLQRWTQARHHNTKPATVLSQHPQLTRNSAPTVGCSALGFTADGIGFGVRSARGRVRADVGCDVIQPSGSAPVAPAGCCICSCAVPVSPSIISIFITLLINIITIISIFIITLLIALMQSFLEFYHQHRVDRDNAHDVHNHRHAVSCTASHDVTRDHGDLPKVPVRVMFVITCAGSYVMCVARSPPLEAPLMSGRAIRHAHFHRATSGLPVVLNMPCQPCRVQLRTLSSRVINLISAIVTVSAFVCSGPRRDISIPHVQLKVGSIKCAGLAPCQIRPLSEPGSAHG
ncbi:hypothetical protein Bbelb_411630 [Branchiostoma belcheri]|nr:hypothetical protein Bbelb_411630 [Branchiostoma belcheri]